MANTNTNPTPATASTSSGQVSRGTDAAATYKPETDSSRQHQEAARKDGRLHLEIGDGSLCLCGCNQTAEARFRPGHDARLKGTLLRAELHGRKIELHNTAAKASVVVAPSQMAAKLDSDKHSWSRALATGVERARKAAAEAARRRAEAKAKREAAAKARGESTKLGFADFAA